MEDKKDPTPPTEEAKPVSISLYQYQIDWLEQQKQLMSPKRGEATRSKVVQKWIDQALKKEQGKK